MFKNNEIAVTPVVENGVTGYDLENMEKQKMLVPTFNNETFNLIPETLRDCVRPVLEHQNQYSAKCRDILLMSNISGFSTIFGKVRFAYKNKLFSLNISYVLKSEPGTNKSIMSLADYVTEKIDQYLQKASQDMHKDWEKKVYMWEQELARAKKEKREPNWDIKPEDEPQIQLMNMPAATSKSQLLLTMKACEENGISISSTEINSLVDAMSKEYGKFADMLCKAILNENPSQFFKVDGKPIGPKRPMLTIRISGTDDQYHKMFQTLGDGLFSRFLHHQGDNDSEWQDQRPADNLDEYNSLFQRISDEAFDMWKWQQQFDHLDIVFTNEQWNRHTAFWSKQYDEFVRERMMKNTDIVKRHGFYQMRVACVLTMIRLWDTRSEWMTAGFDPSTFSKVITCQDVDFQLAEHIAYTLYLHAVAISTTKIEKTSDGVGEMTEWHWVNAALTKLHELYGKMDFTSKDFIDIVTQAPWSKSQSSAYRLLDLLCKQKILRPIKRGSPRRYKLTKASLRKICEK